MVQDKVSHCYDPNRFLDVLAEKLGVTSDKGLSRKLQLARHVIHAVRAGCLPIGASLLLAISEATGIGMPELRGFLGDRRARIRPSGALKSLA
jgi:hypothetical protein